MTLTDPIGDMFTRIRNGQMRSLHSVEIPSSNFRKNILEILKNEGYIKDYFIEKTENNKTSLRITLKYYEGDPVIKEIKRISKPGRRIYAKADSIQKIQNGLGLAIVKHIIEAHNQTINVRSTPEVGSTFSFTLKKD
jgi:small subunit ribosomal protein S8